MRQAKVDRNTTETQISVEVNLDGTGVYDIDTGLGFLDHMLEQLSRHSLIDLTVKAKGDLHIDGHHTTEDTGLAIGQAIHKALGNRAGIMRFGHALMPMDETLGVAAIDLGGRARSVINLRIRVLRVGDLQAELIQDFFEGFAQGARANVHLKVLYGRSSHHQIEAVFKAFARALRVACARDRQLARMLPSTKGLL